MAAWNTSLNGVTLEDNVKETVLARIAQIKTMYLLAKEKEVTLDEAEEAKVVQAAQEYYSSLNDTEIEAMGATEEIVENLYREYAMADKVYQLIIQDINPEISDDEARKITVQQIFFATASTDMDGNLKPYSESSIQSAYEKACEVRDLAVDGEHDFTELASKYSDDSEITYSFGKGEAESAYEEAAFNLATDEVSQVIKCERGYYIIKCINTLDREETDANKLKIVEERKREVFGQEYDSFVNTLVRQLNDKLWDEITLITDEQVTTDNFFDVYAKYFPEARAPRTLSGVSSPVRGSSPLKRPLTGIGVPSRPRIISSTRGCPSSTISSERHSEAMRCTSAVGSGYCEIFSTGKGQPSGKFSII